MRKLCTLVMVVFSSQAFAQSEKPQAPPPGPPAELQQLKDMVGVWKCAGTFTMGEQQMKDTSKAVFSWDLDKRWLAGTFTSNPSKENPDGFKGKAFATYDPAKKVFVSVGVDSMGGVSMGESKGWEGDTWTWTNKASFMGKSLEGKETITRIGKREFKMAGSLGTGADAMSWEQSCKK